ncbi:unnamed protein product, partial [Didymodactylos carnosus]
MSSPQSRNNSLSGQLNPSLRESRLITNDNWQKLGENIEMIDSGFIDFKDVQQALESMSLKIPKYQLTHILQTNYGNRSEKKISKEEFEKLYYDLLPQTNVGITYGTHVKKKENVERFTRSNTLDENETGTKNNSAETTSSVYHTATTEER